jgi:hypothetical protein
MQGFVNVLTLPFRLSGLTISYVLGVLRVLWDFLLFLWEWRSFVVVGLLLWGAGRAVQEHYGVALSQMEHYQRCVLWPWWTTWYEPLVACARDVFDYAVCWTNALNQINRILNTDLFLRVFRECEGEFDVFLWLRHLGATAVEAVKLTLLWLFEAAPLESAAPVWGLARRVLSEVVPETATGVVCLCRDFGLPVLMAARVANSTHLACVAHQLANSALGYWQNAAQFSLNFLGLVRTVGTAGGTPSDVRDALSGATPGDETVLRLSSVTMLERVNSAGLYAGLFLNRVFSVAYCSAVADIEALGDAAASQAHYDACEGDPRNAPDLFCAVGHAVATFNRFLRLSGTFLWHVPQTLREARDAVPGPRWVIDVWYGKDWKAVADTLRRPPPLYYYGASLNFPTQSTPTSWSTSAVKWPNAYIYGPYVSEKPDCDLYNNSHLNVPCEQCPLMVEEPLGDCLCRTAGHLENITGPFLNSSVWNASLCCLVPSVAEVVADVGYFLAGFVAHGINWDRLGAFLSDQNHVDVAFDAFGGRPYVMGGVLRCVSDAAVGLDPRWDFLAGILTTLVKAIAEGLRLGLVGLVRLINSLTGSPEPGLGDYLCLTDPTNCVDLERSLGWLRRPRMSLLVYDPSYGYQNVQPFAQKAFVDWLCYWIDGGAAETFSSAPPPTLPDVCCGLNYGFRTAVELAKALTELVLAVYQTLSPLFFSGPVDLVFVRWAGCEDLAVCNNLGSVLSDLEDLLNCPCLMILEVEELVTAGTDYYYCSCSILGAGARAFSALLRAAGSFFSVAWEVAYCAGTSFPLPNCGTTLATRFDLAFGNVYDALQALSETAGGFGCLVGLSWVGLGIDCQGVAYTWPPDYPPCNTSSNTYLGGRPCTMADRLTMLFYFASQLLAAAVRFVVNRIQAVLDYGLLVTVPGHVTLESGTYGTCQATSDFLLDLGVALFGVSAVSVQGTLNTNTYYKNISAFNDTALLNTTLRGLGMNATLFYLQHPDAANNSGSYISAILNYTPSPSVQVYSSTLNFTNLTGVTATTGLVQAVGFSLDCLVGPPTVSCKGPVLFAASSGAGTSSSCAGFLLVEGGNDFRDFWPLGVLIPTDLCFLFSDLVSADAGAFLTDLLNLVTDTFEFMGAFLGSTTGVLVAFGALIQAMSGYIYGEAAQALFEFTRYALVNTFPQYEFSIMFGEIAAYFGNKRFSYTPYDDLLVANMTEGTYCKESMLVLLEYGDLNPANELIWNLCYFAAALPIMLFNATDGELRLPSDFFYNLNSSLPIVGELFDLLGTYSRHRASMTGSSLITELVRVPEAVLRYAEAQLALQEEAALAENPDAVDVGVIVQVPLLELGNDAAAAQAALDAINGGGSAEEGRRKRSNLPLRDEGDEGDPSRPVPEGLPERVYARYLSGAEAWAGRSAPSPPFYPDPSFGGEGGDGECPSSGGGCATGGALPPGFRGLISVYLDDPASPPAVAYRTEKRGWVDAVTGTALGDNIEYARGAHDGDPLFDPFYRNNVNIYTSLKGNLVLNVTGIGRLLPVVNGKVAIDHSDVTFWDYMRRKGLDGSWNTYAIKSYESFELEHLQDQHLRFGAKAAHFEEVYRNFTSSSSSSSSGDDLDAPSERRAGGSRKRLFDEVLEALERLKERERTDGTPRPPPVARPARRRRTLTEAVAGAFERLSPVPPKRSAEREGREAPPSPRGREEPDVAEGARSAFGSLALLVGGLGDRWRTLTDAYGDRREVAYLYDRVATIPANASLAGRRRSLPDDGGSASSSLRHLQRTNGRYVARLREEGEGKGEAPSEAGLRKYGRYFRETLPAAAVHLLRSFGGYLDLPARDSSEPSYVLYDRAGVPRLHRTLEIFPAYVAGSDASDGDFGPGDDGGYGRAESAFRRALYLSYPEGEAEGGDGFPVDPSEAAEGGDGMLFRIGLNYYEVAYGDPAGGVGCAEGTRFREYREYDLSDPVRGRWRPVDEAGHLRTRAEAEAALRESRTPRTVSLELRRCSPKRSEERRRGSPEAFASVLTVSLRETYARIAEAALAPAREVASRLSPRAVASRFADSRLGRKLAEYASVAGGGGRSTPSSAYRALLFGAWRRVLDLAGRGASPPRAGDRRRTHLPPLFNACLPGHPVTTTCSACDSCAEVYPLQESGCSGCALCFDCAPGAGGLYDCEGCGACRVGGPYCDGGCSGCSGCVSEPECLDCALVQVVLPAIYEQVHFCYEWAVLGNVSVISVPPNGSSLFEAEYANPNASAPEFSDYGWNLLPEYAFDSLLYRLGQLAGGVDLEGTFAAWISETNADPSRGPVGLYFWVTQLPIPWIGRCTRDVNLMCTYGMGLEDALIVVSIVAVVCWILVFLNVSFPVTLFLSVTTFPTLWLGSVASLAWLWNPLCLNNPFLSLLGLLGFGTLAVPGLPVCAADEVYALLAKIVTQYAAYIPDPFYVTANGTFPETCHDRISPPDCSALGFGGSFQTLGYVGQRWFPPSARRWTVDYLNATCLSSGECSEVASFSLVLVYCALLLAVKNRRAVLCLSVAFLIGIAVAATLPGRCVGPLYPLYSRDFGPAIDADVGLADACFYAEIWGSAATVAFLLFAFVAALYLTVPLVGLTVTYLATVLGLLRGIFGC